MPRRRAFTAPDSVVVATALASPVFNSLPYWLMRPKIWGRKAAIASVFQSAGMLCATSNPSCKAMSDPATPFRWYFIADGTTLTLRTEGGVCTDYAGAAVETARSVTVSIQGTWNQATDVACPAIAKVVEVPVALRTPLGGRTVVDERTGAAVPKA